MTHISRRSLLTSLPTVALGGALLAGCATTRVSHTGTSTHITIDVAKVDAYITAGINAANTTLTLMAGIPTLVQYIVPLKATLGLLEIAASSFHGAAGNEVTLHYNSANIKSRVDSVLGAIEQITGLLSQVIADLAKAGFTLGNQTFNRIQLTYESLKTIVSVFIALISTYTADARPATGTQMAMAEQRALRVLNA